MTGTTYNEGFLIESMAAYGDAQSLSTGLYKIGIPPPDSSDAFVEINAPMEYQENVSFSSTYPTIHIGNDPMKDIKIGPFAPVNAIPFGMMFGGYSAGTISNFTKGSQKQRYSWFTGTTDESSTREEWAFGWVCSNLEMDFDAKTSNLTMSLNGPAELHGTDADTNYAPTSYKYPDSNGDGSGTQSTKPFNWINNVTWNDVALGNCMTLKAVFSQAVKGYGPDSTGMYIDINDQAAITGAVTLTALGYIDDATNGLRADKYAGTKGDLSFTLRKSGNVAHYLTCDMDNAACVDLVRKRVGGDKVISTGLFIIEGFSTARVSGETNLDGTHEDFFTKA